MDNAEKVLIGMLVFICFVLAVVLIGAATEALTARDCLRCGWKEARITVTFDRYCIREENEYEITRPLWWVLEHCEDEWYNDP